MFNPDQIRKDIAMQYPTISADSLVLTSSQGVTTSSIILTGTVTDIDGRSFPDETIIQYTKKRQFSREETVIYNRITGHVKFTVSLVKPGN